MKDRRGFLKLLGIGAGAAVAMVAARMAQTPATPPRTIQDIERPVRPYIGPDSIPGGDYIKERPKVVPEHIKTPPPQPGIYRYDLGEIDWDTVEWTVPLELGEVIPVGITTEEVHTISGSMYDHNLGGYLVTTDNAFKS